jgi:hypothetical protein
LARPGTDALRRALAEYLTGAGEETLSRAVLGGEVAQSVTGTGGAAVHVYFLPADLERAQADGRATAAIAAAVRDLVGDRLARVVLHPL